MISESKSNKTIQQIFKALKWLFAIVFLICSLGALVGDKAYLPFILFLVCGLLLLPPLTAFWNANLPFLSNAIYKGILIFVIFIVAIITLPESTKNEVLNKEKPVAEKKIKQEIPLTKLQIDSIEKYKKQRVNEAVAQAEANQIARDNIERKDKIESQFSLYDGSHRNLEKYIEENMNDPDSYEHVETGFEDKGKYILVRTKFRGKNAFGGKVINYITAKVDIDGNVLQIISQE